MNINNLGINPNVDPQNRVEDNRASQQNQLIASKNKNFKGDNQIKFPSNQQIEDQITQAQDLESKGIALDRGSIVNILV